MARRSIEITDTLYDYLLARNRPLTAAENGLRDKTSELTMRMMQISPEQGFVMEFLIKLIGAKNAIEVGTFTGYSALITAQALPNDGKLIACDVSEEWTSVGRPFWREAGVEHKIDLRLGPAVGTLDALLAEGREGQFDFMFIDADKSNYGAYYERGLKLVRKGGLIAIDNVLWGGKVADDTVVDDDTVAIRNLNSLIQNDSRVDSCLTTIGDGVTLARVL